MTKNTYNPYEIMMDKYDKEEMLSDVREAMLYQLGILFGFQGHYLNLQVAEIRFCQIQRPGNVGNTCCGRVFTGYEQ